ncbi:transposable element Tcb2 transposase [Trichonephila clavipes]|nr:transposable element Tcb2 transposase [Trichonephila clavipes]
MQRDCALRIAGRGRLSSFSVGYKTGVGTSESERCHLHEDQSQDALDRSVVEKTPHRKKCTRTANCFIGRHPGTAEWNQVDLRDESRLNLSSDDNRVRVWRSHGERLNPAFALQRYATFTACVRVWGAIVCNTRLPLVLIRGTMTAQRYVHDILQPHVLPLMQRLLGAIFQQINARPHMARVSQNCLRTLLPFLGLPDPQICLQSSISEIIWDGELGIPRV